MRGSRLPPGGENVLQTIRARRAVAEERGVKLLDLSIGEPRGPSVSSRRTCSGAWSTRN